MDQRLQNTTPIQARPSAHVSRPSIYGSRPATSQTADPATVITQFLQNQPPVTAWSAPVTAAAQVTAVPTPLVSHHSKPLLADNGQPEKRPLRKHLTAVFSVLAILAFATSGIMLLGGSKADNQKLDKILSLASSADYKSSPSEAPITADEYKSYRTAPELARYMTIAKLNLKTRVTELGAKSNNTLMPPGSIYDAAWYNGSAKPDQRGATVIEGYAQGPTKPGIFAGVTKLKTGDKIQLETGSGVRLKYKVVKIQTYDIKSINMAAILKPISGGKGLNIITCSGSKTDRNQRVVVFTTQI